MCACDVYVMCMWIIVRLPLLCLVIYLMYDVCMWLIAHVLQLCFDCLVVSKVCSVWHVWVMCM